MIASVKRAVLAMGSFLLALWAGVHFVGGRLDREHGGLSNSKSMVSGPELARDGEPVLRTKLGGDTVELELKVSEWRPCESSLPEGASDAQVRECALAGLEAAGLPESEQLGAWLCSSIAGKHTKQVVCEEILKICPTGDVLAYIDAVQQSCGRYLSTALFNDCIYEIGSRDPAWVEAVGRTLTPDLMFDSRKGVAVVQAAFFLASVAGGDWAEYLLGEGGLGNFGGTGDQIDRAATASLVLKKNPGESLRYILDLIQSTNAPGGIGLGNTIIVFLFSEHGECWPNGDPMLAVSYAAAALEDGRFDRAASAQLLANYSLLNPPHKSLLGTDAWASLIRKAEEIKSFR